MTVTVNAWFGRGPAHGLAALLIVIGVVGASASAAGQSDTGSISGTIQDEVGGVLPGATVTARSTATGLSRSAVSDAGGNYDILRLVSGSYEVEASLPGFRGRATTVTVGASAADLDFTLAIAPLAETVNVTRADRSLAAVPNAVTVIQREQVDFAQRKASLDEALRGIPGLLVQNRRNYGLSGGVGISIRSPQPRFGLRGLALIQDGIPITTADGTTEPGNVDLGSAGRIEVIRGPSSVLYGNSAGGVISLFTEIDPSRRLTVRPDLQVGSNGYNREQVRVDGHNNSGTQFMGSFSRFETDGWRQQSAAEIRQTNVVVRQALSANTDISGVFNHFDSPFAESASFLNETDARNNPRMARPVAISQNWGEGAEQGQGGVTLERRFAGTQLFRATGWGVWRDLFASGPGRVIDLGRNGAGFRSEYLGAGQLGSMAVEWTAGLDVSSQNDDRMEFENLGPSMPGGVAERGTLFVDQLEDVLSAGPFAQVSISPHTRVTVTAGVRYDYYKFEATDRKLDDGDQSGERTMNAASPSVGLTFAATPTVNLYANLATAYETPTTVELSNRPSGEGGFNQLLDPERLRSFEVGVRGLVEPARLQYEIAVFRARLLDALVPFQRPDEQTFFANAGESARNGVELSLNWQPVSRVSARFAYTYQDFVFEEFMLGDSEFAGNVEPGSPPHRLFAGADYAAPFGLRSGVTLRWVDDFFVNNANTAANWGVGA